MKKRKGESGDGWGIRLLGLWIQLLPGLSSRAVRDRELSDLCWPEAEPWFRVAMSNTMKELW